MQAVKSWRKKPALVYPIPPAPLTAILFGGFRSSGNMRVFESGWNEQVAAFGPAALAATPVQLESLYTTSIPSLRNAIIALILPDQPRLAEEVRDALWRAFRVPVFEQKIDESCLLLAFECEAHDGLHLEDSSLQPQEGEILVVALCGCGRTTPRLTLPAKVEKLREAAANAR